MLRYSIPDCSDQACRLQSLSTNSRRQLSAVLLLAVAAMIHVGCASPLTTATGEGLAQSGERVANQPLAADIVHPMNAFERTFDIIAGDHAGQQILIEQSETNQFHAQWQQVESRIDPSNASRTKLRTDYLRREADGSIVLTAVIDHADRAVSLFDPPLLLAPAEISPGMMYESTVAMRVVDERNPARQRESGNATRSMTLIDSIDLHVEDRRPVRVLRLDVQFSADMQLADAITISEIFVMPDQGVHAMSRDERITILNAFQRNSRQTLVRTEMSD